MSRLLLENVETFEFEDGSIGLNLQFSDGTVLEVFHDGLALGSVEVECASLVDVLRSAEPPRVLEA